MPQIQKGYLFPAIRAFRRTATLQPAVCGQRMMHMPQNRIYNSIRNHEDFTSILLTSTANNIPLITLWTTTWCSTCRTVVPLIREIIENKDSRYLSKECKVNFAEVELDAPDMGWGFGARYMIRSIPTLLAFRRSLAQTDKALTKSEDLTNREILVRWIEDVAKEGEDDRKYRQGVLSSLWSQ